MDQWKDWQLIMSPLLTNERLKKTASNGTDRQRDRQTDGHSDLQTELAQWADSVKISEYVNQNRRGGWQTCKMS